MARLLADLLTDSPRFTADWTTVVATGNSVAIEEYLGDDEDKIASLNVNCAIEGNAYSVYDDQRFVAMPGEEICCALDYTPESYVGDFVQPFCVGNAWSSETILFVYLKSVEAHALFLRNDFGNYNVFPMVLPYVSGKEVRLAFKIKRSSGLGFTNGYTEMYVDGVFAAGGNVANYSRVDQFGLTVLGRVAYGNAGTQMRYRNFLIGDTLDDVTLIPSEPTAETFCAQRTMLVYRAGDANGFSFACYAAENYGIPYCNIVPVPCNDNEYVLDLNTFQNQVENPLKQWLADRPLLAEQITCILLCPGVPGYYGVAGKYHSATARLNNIGFEKDGITVNPLAGATQRVTRSTLGPGRYMVTRIDADSLIDSKAILDATDSEICIDNAEDSAAPIQTGGGTCWDAISIGNLAAAGMSDSPEANEIIDPQAFYTMLHGGGTFAEAIHVASSHFDGKIMALGNPLLSLSNQAGHYFFVSPGAPDQIDWQKPSGWVPADRDTATIHAPLEAAKKYAVGIRSTSASGTQERNTHVVGFVEIDENDEFQPAPLPKPIDITACRVAENTVRIGFTCQTPIAYSYPNCFEVLGDSGLGTIDVETPLASVTNIEPGQTDFVLDVPATVFPCKFAVQARSNLQTGLMSHIVCVAENRQPTHPVIL